MMDQYIADFSKQLESAMDIGQQADLRINRLPIQQVLVMGLGGSGIGGDLVAGWIADSLSVPMQVSKDYDIPAYVNDNTLVIVSSYSGNTEETLSALKQAMDKGAHIVAITSGGELKELSGSANFDHILIPGGMPPRACLAYSFVQQLYTLHFHRLIDNDFESKLYASIALLEKEADNIKSIAQDMASKLYDKLPIIYAPDGYGAVAVRLRQQINENGKMLCWHHVIPEMNHNELVGWRDFSDKWAPIFLEADDVHQRTKYRIQINQEIIGKYVPKIYNVKALGSSRIEKSLYLVNLGDWLSFYLAGHRKMDAVEVDVIDYLKGKLSNM